jgi:hypothetical protein
MEEASNFEAFFVLRWLQQIFKDFRHFPKGGGNSLRQECDKAWV